MTHTPAAPEATSVIIAAHTMKRVQDVAAATASVLSQQPPPREVVVAVDNNNELYEWARNNLPGVTTVAHWGLRGASATRNAGARAASGSILAFMDDDAVAWPGWLQSLVAPLGSPGIIGVGGHLDPIWPGVTPGWMPGEFLWIVGASYRGLPEIAGPVRNVWSGNMAVMRSDFRAVGGFREDFGKTDHASSPEDTEFCIRLASAMDGGSWWYEPSARVGHKVPPERCTLRFFLWRCRNEGQGKAELSMLMGPHEGLRSERRHAFKTIPAGMGRELRAAVTNREINAARRAAAIGVGFGTTSLGYAVRRARLAAAGRSAAPRDQDARPGLAHERTRFHDDRTAAGRPR